MNPQFPVYIISKGRHESRLTSRALEYMSVPYHIVVEPQERDAYASVIDAAKVLVLDMAYKAAYETHDPMGDAKGIGPGSGPARNFVWDHSIASGAAWHWIVDDNIDGFFRLNRNLKVPVSDGTIFRCMEDFVLRYQNLAMAGPNYFKFATRKGKMPPYVLNTRLYSCNLIRNSLPFRWSGRYNEDLHLSLRILKAGWCTVQFNAFLQDKATTQKFSGGNKSEFYASEGTLPKSRMIVDLHPDVAKVVWKFNRWHHSVDYRPFKTNRLIPRADLVIPDGVNDYGMSLRTGATDRW